MEELIAGVAGFVAEAAAPLLAEAGGAIAGQTAAILGETAFGAFAETVGNSMQLAWSALQPVPAAKSEETAPASPA